MPPELIEYGEACGPPQRRDAQIFDLTIAVRPQAGLESQRLSTFLPGFVNSLRGQAAMPVPVFVRKSGVPSGLPLLYNQSLFRIAARAESRIARCAG